MKKQALIIAIILFSGCLTETKYVCTDGSTVDDPLNCPTTKTTLAKTHVEINCSIYTDDTRATQLCELENQKTTEYCMSLPDTQPAFDQTSCLITLASWTKDKKPCESLTGNYKITCDAIAARDQNMCVKIPIEDLKEKCEAGVRQSDRPQPEKITCENQTGEPLIWCLIYNSQTTNDCLQIDETTHLDESIFCQANTLKAPNMCLKMQDKIMQNLCLKKASNIADKYVYNK